MILGANRSYSACQPMGRGLRARFTKITDESALRAVMTFLVQTVQYLGGLGEVQAIARPSCNISLRRYCMYNHVASSGRTTTVTLVKSQETENP